MLPYNYSYIKPNDIPVPDQKMTPAPHPGYWRSIADYCAEKAPLKFRVFTGDLTGQRTLYCAHKTEI